MAQLVVGNVWQWLGWWGLWAGLGLNGRPILAG